MHISWEDFEKVDIQVGRVVYVEKFLEGTFSTHIFIVGLGDTIGRKKSLARLTPHYDDMNLVGSQVLCVVNVVPKQIGPHVSEVLILGLPDADDNVVLIQPEREVPVGEKLY